MRQLVYAAVAHVAAVIVAPLISQDPLADNTDVYAFVSPERTDRVVLISYFQAGRVADAHAASVRARRTGSADRRILCHAAAIKEAPRQPRDSPAGVNRAQCGFEQWITEPEAELLSLGR